MCISFAPKSTDLYHLGAISPGAAKDDNPDPPVRQGRIQWPDPGPVAISYSALDGIPETEQTGIDVMTKGKAESGFVTVDTSPPRLTDGTPFDLTVRKEEHRNRERQSRCRRRWTCPRGHQGSVHRQDKAGSRPRHNLTPRG